MAFRLLVPNCHPVPERIPRHGQEYDLFVYSRPNAGEQYVAHDVSKNGLNGEFGQINVAAGTTARLLFRFTFEGQTEVVPEFVFSLFDIDNGWVGKEIATVETYSEWTVLSALTELEVNETVSATGENILRITSTAHGSEEDNPAHPLALTEAHLKRAISIQMPSLSMFYVEFTAQEGMDGRNFLFGGPTQLVCSERALCSTFTCPDGTLLRADADRHVCAQRVCRSSDTASCCEESARL